LRRRLAALAATAPGRLVGTLLIAALGWLCTRIFHVEGLTRSATYVYLATALLAVGLYSSTRGIDLREARHSLRTVLLAVTLGVGAKALLIAGVMYAAFRRPEYLVLGVAVAQIDPLSVAAMRMRSRMSERAKAVLLAWASFDDPVTALLTIYLSGLTLSILHEGSRSGLGDDGTLLSFGMGLTQSLVFVACAFLIWKSLNRIGRRRSKRPDPSRPRFQAPSQPSSQAPFARVQAPLSRPRDRRNGLAIAALVGLFSVAVWSFTMLGLALAGLFFRPALGKWVARLTGAAFLLAVFALGLLLGPGIHLAQGLVLGVAAFVAQAVVSVLIARRHTRDDRVYLALGQQNGITAIILALLLEPSFPGTVGIVAPAILVVNVLNIAANAVWEHRDSLAAHLRRRLPSVPALARRRRVPVAVPVRARRAALRRHTADLPAGGAPHEPAPARLRR
jgi:hypothetical protein